MLVDLTPIEHAQKAREDSLREMFPDIPEKDYWKHILSYPEAHLEKGIYYAYADGNFDKYLFEETNGDHFGYQSYFWNETEHVNGWIPPYTTYGSADNIEQIKDFFRRQIKDPEERYFIVIHPVFQNKEDRGSGFKWHKNGCYIGKFKSKCIYLNDEEFGPDFQGYILMFHCYKLI